MTDGEWHAQHAVRVSAECDTLRGEIDRLQRDLATLRRRLAWAESELWEATGRHPRGDLASIA